MKLSLLFFSLSVISLSISANDPFSELDQEMAVYEQQSADSPVLENDFQTYMDEQEKQYQTWLVDYLKKFDQFQQDLVSKWGEGDTSSSQRNVEFSDNDTVKSVIDYENEQLSVAILVDKDLSQEELQAVVETKIESLIQDKQSNISRVFDDGELLKQGSVTVGEIAFSDEKKEKVKDRIVKQTQSQMQEIDKKADRQQLTADNSKGEQSQQIAIEEKAELIELTKQRIQKAEGGYQEAQKNAPNDKKIAIYKVNLPKNSLKKRAQKYAGMAEKEGQIRAISPALVMAIMHSESAFDPRATSPIPAYGLMQIVPTTAGHDVNRAINNIDKPMRKNDLYVPEINVQAGTAYLDILDKRYLKGIRNAQSRLYCTIAAYNTGAGNVARVFNKNGSRNINKAAVEINKLSAEQVYEQLINHLPYDETKHYLRRVNSRISLYQTKISPQEEG